MAGEMQGEIAKMKKLSYFCIISFIFIFSSSASAAQNRITEVDTKIEASWMNRVTAIALADSKVIFGTPFGIASLEDGKTPNLFKSFNGFVSSIEYFQKNFYVGSENGLYRFDGNKFSNIYVSSSIKDSFISSITQFNGNIYAGSWNGLIELIPGGGSRIIALPDEQQNIQALFSDKKGILVATPGKLYRYSQPDSWSLIREGSTYKALVSTSKNFWMGLRSDGTVDICDDRPFAIPVKLELPFAGDAVTAMTFSANGEKILIGTIRGRILSAEATTELNRVSWKEVYSSRFGNFPIRTLASNDGKKIYCGTEGGGMMVFAIGAEEPEWLTSDSKSSPPPMLAETVEKTDEYSRLRKELSTLENKLSSRKSLSLILGIGFLILIAILIAVKMSRSSSSKTLVKEKRKSHRKKMTPPIEKLSPDIAEYAKKLKVITERINEVTRQSALRKDEELALETKSIYEEFEEIDSWLRMRQQKIQEERVEKMSRLAEIRRLLKESDGKENESLSNELREIEAWSNQAIEDEKYFKYVLEA